MTARDRLADPENLRRLFAVFAVLTAVAVAGLTYVLVQEIETRDRLERIEQPTLLESRARIFRALELCARDQECRDLFAQASPRGKRGPPGKDGSRGRPGADGRDGRPGATVQPTPEDLAAAVRSYCATRNDCRGRTGSTGPPGGDGRDGRDGARGPGPTDEQVRRAVAAYCQAEPGNCSPAAVAPRPLLPPPLDG